MTELTHNERVLLLKRAVAELKTGQCIFFDRKPQLGYWQTAIKSLVDAGVIEATFVDMPEDQYSRLEIRRKGKDHGPTA